MAIWWASANCQATGTCSDFKKAFNSPSPPSLALLRGMFMSSATGRIVCHLTHLILPHFTKTSRTASESSRSYLTNLHVFLWEQREKDFYRTKRTKAALQRTKFWKLSLHPGLPTPVLYSNVLPSAVIMYSGTKELIGYPRKKSDQPWATLLKFAYM